VRQLRAKGLDPFDVGVQYDHKAALYLSFLQRIRQAIKETRPGCLVCPQNQGTFYGLAQRAPLVDYSSQEALFTDAPHYGYHYFPTVIRYARGYGIPFHGCTVIFKDFWADFGGLKSPAQMKTEVAAYVSQGARCDIGDQVHPDGHLDPAVYHVIGQAYQHIERIEPYLEQAVPVTEAALLGSGDAPCNEVNYGWVKLLNESKVQFDIVERNVKWEERYALIVLPENLQVDQTLASRLQAFIAAGGAMIAAHTSGLLAGTETSWLEPYGLHYAGMSPFTPVYMVPSVNFTGDIPSYAYALYEGASQWRAESADTSLAALGEPLFQRSPEHYNSHLQTPLRSHHPLCGARQERPRGPNCFPSGSRLLQPGILGLSASLSEGAQRSVASALNQERCSPEHRTVIDPPGSQAKRWTKRALYGAYRELLPYDENS
jgi:hypothetical protein